MTFEEWQATGRDVDAETVAKWGDFSGNTGREYEAGFLIREGNQWVVYLPTTSYATESLEDAEIYLWGEWCDGEINA